MAPRQGKGLACHCQLSLRKARATAHARRGGPGARDMGYHLGEQRPDGAETSRYSRDRARRGNRPGRVVHDRPLTDQCLQYLGGVSPTFAARLGFLVAVDHGELQIRHR